MLLFLNIGQYNWRSEQSTVAEEAIVQHDENSSYATFLNAKSLFTLPDSFKIKPRLYASSISSAF